MIITKLEKKKRLYLLELDSGDSCYITEDTLVRFFLTKGKAITPEELEEIKNFAQFSHGKNLALYYLSFKPRTRREVADYLKQNEIDPLHHSAILDQLEKDNWLNDHHYAQTFIHQNLTSGDKGPFALAQKLQLKGVDKGLIQDLLAASDFTQVAERLAEKLARKYQHKLSSKGLEDKIIQHMSTKGFSYSQAQTAFKHLQLQTDEEEQTQLLYKELDKYYRKYSRKYEGYDLKQRLTQALARKGFDFDDIRAALRDYL